MLLELLGPQTMVATYMAQGLATWTSGRSHEM